ncbi:uncharacterized protein F5147DRAFT_650771 [Suillus discolor]|uniref:Uncharacterized protein n=1 Tax=Suillus discolor TaxID=1912936 RepID=A0A9P7FDA7_9AGAM|nr:uncharacterized protein F5147DRAFT_650771 [Suillus discolor]KAG2112600.1 hypothetical protein F5147DRAFT_650771 [Suillus discolor]
MSAAVMDLVEIFNGEGAFVFVDRPAGGPPIFHVQRSADLQAGSPQLAGCSGSGVMLATEELRKYPTQLIAMVHRLANDTTVTAAYADTIEMAEYLVAEARKVPYAPYILGAGQLLREFMRNDN